MPKNSEQDDVKRRTMNATSALLELSSLLSADLQPSATIEENRDRLETLANRLPSASIAFLEHWRPPLWLWIENPRGCKLFVQARSAFDRGDVGAIELAQAFKAAEFRAAVCDKDREALRACYRSGGKSFRAVFRLFTGPQ